MKSPDPFLFPGARERVLALVAKGRYIPAIKIVREVTGLGLKEAKAYVDGLKAEAFARAVSPDVRAKANALVAADRRKEAVKLVRQELGLNTAAAREFVDALQDGRVPDVPPPPADPYGMPRIDPYAPVEPYGAPPAAPAPRGVLSDRVRAFKRAGDYESAIALVCAETGMGRDEAHRFVDALR